MRDGISCDTFMLEYRYKKSAKLNSALESAGRHNDTGAWSLVVMVAAPQTTRPRSQIKLYYVAVERKWLADRLKR